MSAITTTAGEQFTYAESVDMARLILKRFGNDPEVATIAWRRLLQNGTTVHEFMELINNGNHTPHCRGECQRTSEHNGH